MASVSRPGRYVYGVRVLGLDDVGELADAAAAAPGDITVDVRQSEREPPATVALDGQRAVLRLLDGHHLELDRRAGTARFFGPHISSDQLAHPYLGPVATAFNRWAGREAFHGGAFVMDGRAWGVLGGRTAGKSTLLALLAARGFAVLADDILITDGLDAYAGPRCIDLREPLPSVAAPAGRSTAPARLGSRLRVPLDAVAPRVRLGGWLFLRWGPAALDPVGPDELLVRLAARHSWPGLPSDPVTLLEIASRPAWDLTRPRDWAAVPDVLAELARTLTAGAAVGAA